MHDALMSARDYLEPQHPDDSPEESIDLLAYTFSIGSAEPAIEGARGLLAEHDASVVLRWELAAGTVEIEARPTGDTWQSNGTPLTAALTTLKDRGDRPEWKTEDLRPAFPELDKAAASYGRLTLRKRSWRAPLEDELNRTLWMGPSMTGFEHWVLQQGGRELTSVFMARPGVGVIVADSPTTLDQAEPRIEVAPLDGHLVRAASDTELQARLQRQGRQSELPFWRAANLRPQAPLPLTVRTRLWGVASSAAAWVIAEEHVDPHTVRPRRDRARSYELPDMPPDLDDRSGGAIRDLASWVSEDVSSVRLAVAQRVAATEIADPFDTGSAPAIRQAADIGYRVAIDRTVQDALQRQAVFEQTFSDLDKSVAEIRKDISSAIDQVVTRTLTGASAFTIAALASPRFRGTAALVAGALIAIFVLANLMLLCRSTRPSALARLQDADDQIAKRRAQLSPELSEALTMRLDTWREDVKRQIRAGAAILAVLTVTLVGVGLGVSLTTSYESGSPSRSCSCHVSGRQSTCNCGTN